MSVVSAISTRAILTSVFLILYSGCSHANASNIVEYSHVEIYRAGWPVCKGILLNHTVISVAHCVNSHDDLSIHYVRDGHPESAAPLSLAFDHRSRRTGSLDDVVAIRISSAERADIDGKIDIASNVGLSDIGIDPTFKFIIEEKPSIGGQRSIAAHPSSHIPMRHVRTFGQLAEFAEISPALTSRPKVGPDRSAAFSLSMSRSMVLQPSDLLCQGRSGSPLLGTRNGINYLAGILVKGEHRYYVDGRWCGTTIGALRMDVGILDWIDKQIR
jgi:hypothetical protein